MELPEGVPEPHRSGIQRMRFDSAGDLIVAGEFTSIDGVALSHLAVLRGTTWSAIGLPPDAPVYALSIEGDEICAGGLFASIGGVSASRVACWDGAQWTPRDLVDPVTGGVVRALARGPDGTLYAGGIFVLSDLSTNDGGSIARWDGAEWQLIERGLGIWDMLSQQNTPGLVRDMAWVDEELLVGGTFRRWRHQLRRRARSRSAAPRELPARVELLDRSRRRDPRRGRRLCRRQRLLNFERRRSGVRGRNLLLGRRDDGVQRGTAQRRVVGVAHDDQRRAFWALRARSPRSLRGRAACMSPGASPGPAEWQRRTSPYSVPASDSPHSVRASRDRSTALAVDATTDDLYAAETVCVELPGQLDSAHRRASAAGTE